MEVRDWVCEGWRVSFTRADMLNNHHRTPIGQACLVRIQREAQAQIQTQSQMQMEIQNTQK
jgi:hypothetical protein